MQKKPKQLTWRIKHIARDIARSCEMPYEEAVKLLQVIINILQVKLKSEKRLSIRNFGLWKYSKLKRPNNRAAYRIITFTPSVTLNAYLGNYLVERNFKYEVNQSRKTRRLLLAGDIKQAKKIYKRLIIRLETRPEAKQFLLDKKYIPVKFK